MKHRLVLFVSSLLLIMSSMALPSRSVSHKQDLSELNWLLGTWQRTNVRPGTTAFETWKKVNSQLFTGIGVSMRGSDTTFVEKLRIELKNDQIYYVADVKENTKPTYFLMSEMSSKGFKSANPAHDFPKHIDYSLDEGKMIVIISDGGEKQMGFMFQKKP